MDNSINISAIAVQNSVVQLMLVTSMHQRHGLIIADIENKYLNAKIAEKV